MTSILSLHADLRSGGTDLPLASPGSAALVREWDQASDFSDLLEGSKVHFRDDRPIERPSAENEPAVTDGAVTLPSAAWLSFDSPLAALRSSPTISLPSPGMNLPEEGNSLPVGAPVADVLDAPFSGGRAATLEQDTAADRFEVLESDSRREISETRLVGMVADNGRDDAPSSRGVELPAVETGPQKSAEPTFNDRSSQVANVDDAPDQPVQISASIQTSDTDLLTSSQFLAPQTADTVGSAPVGEADPEYLKVRRVPTPPILAPTLPPVQNTAPSMTVRGAVRSPQADPIQQTGEQVSKGPGAVQPLSPEPVPDDASLVDPEQSKPDKLASLSSASGPSPSFQASSSPTATTQPAAAALATLTAPSFQSQPQAQPAAAVEIRPSVPLEATIEQLASARETGRAASGDLTMRHQEFGAINMRLEVAGGDLRAVLASRDPGFVPAIQAALAERAVAASQDTASTSTGGQQNGRGHESSSHSQSGHSSNPQNWNGNAFGQSEGRYGSSPGSGQGSPQPYFDQNDARDEEKAPAGKSRQSNSGQAALSGNGLFA